MTKNAACVNCQSLEAGESPVWTTRGILQERPDLCMVVQATPVSYVMGDPYFNSILASWTRPRWETRGSWDSSAKAVSERQGSNIPAHPLEVRSVTSRTHWAGITPTCTYPWAHSQPILKHICSALPFDGPKHWKCWLGKNYGYLKRGKVGLLVPSHSTLL